MALTFGAGVFSSNNRAVAPSSPIYVRKYGGRYANTQRACENAGTVTESGHSSASPPPSPRGASLPATATPENLAENLIAAKEWGVAKATAARPQRLDNCLEQAEPDPEPFRLGWQPFDKNRYPAQGVLGSGGYGTVYLSEDQETGQLVAVKRIPKARRCSTPEKVKRNLLKEAAVLSEMQFSPLVCQMVDKFEDSQNAYLVLEYLKGGSLEDYVYKHRRDLTETDVASIAHAVLSFLDECHQVGIVFADVKPANFMLCDNDDSTLKLKAIDFGCSQLKPEDEFLTARTGTFKYFAPEVFKQRYGTAADDWSTGIMMYRIMAGVYPWWSPNQNVCPADAMEDVCSKSPVPFQEENWARWSPEARSFIEALLQKDASNRMTAAEALHHPWLLQNLHSSSGHRCQQWPYSNIIPMKLGTKEVAAN